MFFFHIENFFEPQLFTMSFMFSDNLHHQIYLDCVSIDEFWGAKKHKGKKMG